MSSPADLSPTRPRRVATVDVGSNSIRLLVAEVRPDGGYRVVDEEKIVARLGRGTARSRRLEEAAMHDATRAIARLRAIADGYDVEILRAVTTCAVREAENREAFLNRVRDEAGLELEVISGEEEARFAWHSVRNAFDIHSRDVAIVDIGGGSTEIAIACHGLLERISSMSLGAVRVTEAAGGETAPPAQRLQCMRDLLADEIRRCVARPDPVPEVMIGTGGTFTALAAMDVCRRRPGNGNDESPLNVRGHEVRRATVRRLLERLNAMSLRERLTVPGLSEDRAEIIAAGLAIIEVVMKRLGVDTLQVHDRGIRDGLLLSMRGELFPDARREAAPGESPPDPLQAALRFAERCNYERPHCTHVAGLALSIHDQLATQLPLPSTVLGDERNRLILHAASLLHDIGYLVNYARHHKHSHHLIMHSDLPGFTHRELELMANVARYHRRARPKKRHANFKRLVSGDRRIVKELAAILRIADGLDRAHAGTVRHVQVKVQPPTALFVAESDRPCDVELWGATRKSRLFEKTFSLQPRFLRDGEAEAEPMGPESAAGDDADTGTLE
ncbi:MAG: Ppx/GppA phosphatase family protein [Planctomycetota bacterium]|nr:Ppx/GppA phosphatase family protein [Planctomycetota bacterium]